MLSITFVNYKSNIQTQTRNIRYPRSNGKNKTKEVSPDDLNGSITQTRIRRGN